MRNAKTLVLNLVCKCHAIHLCSHDQMGRLDFTACRGAPAGQIVVADGMPAAVGEPDADPGAELVVAGDAVPAAAPAAAAAVPTNKRLLSQLVRCGTLWFRTPAVPRVTLRLLLSVSGAASCAASCGASIALIRNGNNVPLRCGNLFTLYSNWKSLMKGTLLSGFDAVVPLAVCESTM